MSNKFKKGFTLVELLVVLGLLLILLTATLIAINPGEQISKTRDTSARAVSEDIKRAVINYVTLNKTTPWEANPDCQLEITNGGSLSSLDECIEELTSGGQLKTALLSKDYVAQMTVTSCGSSAVVCYNPISHDQSVENDVIYDQDGQLNNTCPGDGSGNCYWCETLYKTSDCSIAD